MLQICRLPFRLKVNHLLTSKIISKKQNEDKILKTQRTIQQRKVTICENKNIHPSSDYKS